MSKSIILKLKAHLGWNPKTKINYIIGGDFLQYYNKED